MGYKENDERSLMTEVNGRETEVPMNRRNAVKAFVGLGLASALTDCTPASGGGGPGRRDARAATRSRPATGA
jgi:hypothetical protein